MTDYRDPKTGERTAVLRPENPKKSIADLAEWNAILDRAADDPHAQERAQVEAKRFWIDTLLKGQRWQFRGWLSTDTAQTSGAPAAPGDLQVPEKQYVELYGPESDPRNTSRAR